MNQVHFIIFLSILAFVFCLTSPVFADDSAEVNTENKTENTENNENIENNQNNENNENKTEKTEKVKQKKTKKNNIKLNKYQR